MTSAFLVLNHCIWFILSWFCTGWEVWLSSHSSAAGDPALAALFVQWSVFFPLGVCDDTVALAMWIYFCILCSTPLFHMLLYTSTALFLLQSLEYIWDYALLPLLTFFFCLGLLCFSVVLFCVFFFLVLWKMSLEFWRECQWLCRFLWMVSAIFTWWILPLWAGGKSLNHMTLSLISFFVCVLKFFCTVT